MPMPMPMQEAEIGWKKVSFRPLLCLLCLVATQKITHAAHSLSWLGELHVKAGYVSPLLARAPSLHVNRPLNNLQFPP